MHVLRNIVREPSSRARGGQAALDGGVEAIGGHDGEVQKEGGDEGGDECG